MFAKLHWSFHKLVVVCDVAKREQLMIVDTGVIMDMVVQLPILVQGQNCWNQELSCIFFCLLTSLFKPDTHQGHLLCVLKPVHISLERIV